MLFTDSQARQLELGRPLSEVVYLGPVIYLSREALRQAGWLTGIQERGPV